MPISCRMFECVGGLSTISLKEEIISTVEKLGYNVKEISEKIDDVKIIINYNNNEQGIIKLIRHKKAIIVILAMKKGIVMKIVKELSRKNNIMKLNIDYKKLRKIIENKILKVVVFDMVRIPGIRRVILTGSSISDTELFREYSDVCDMRYVVYEDHGKTFGVSATGVVVSFSRISVEELLEYVEDTILPLVLRG